MPFNARSLCFDKPPQLINRWFRGVHCTVICSQLKAHCYRYDLKPLEIEDKIIRVDRLCNKIISRFENISSFSCLRLIFR